jgi:hypothetical protein
MTTRQSLLAGCFALLSCATVAMAQEVPAASLGNLSTRLRVETGDNVLIGGFIITGRLPRR